MMTTSPCARVRQNQYRLSGDGEREFTPNVYYPEKYANIRKRQLEEYVDNYFNFTYNPDDFVYSSDIYASYQKFCERRQYTPISSIISFSRFLKEVIGKGCTVNRRRNSSDDRNQWGYSGLKLAVDAMTDVDEYDDTDEDYAFDDGDYPSEPQKVLQNGQWVYNV